MREKVAKYISKSPYLIQSAKNNSPGFRHWVKSLCSKYENEFWKLDEEMIMQYLYDWQDLRIINIRLKRYHH